MSNSNITKRLAQVQSKTLHVGIDLALDDNVAIVIDETARQCDRFHFANDLAGYQFLLERLEQVRQRQGAGQVVCAMEPTNYFWKLLANWLEQKQMVYQLVNPYTVNRHREGDQLDRSKDDPRDAFVIADLSRTGKYTETQLQRKEYAELREYATLYHQLTRNIQREKNILWGLVGQGFPELKQACKNLTGATAEALLRTCPAAATIRQLSEVDFVTQVSLAFTGKRLGTAKLHQAYHLAQSSVGLTDGLQANALAIRIHLDHLRSLQHERLLVISALKTWLQQVAVAPYLLSFQGLGTLAAALILAEIGEPERYSKASQLVKLGGIQPVPNRSGRKQRSATPMSHQGRPRLRTALYLACLRLVRCDPHFQEVYHQLQTRPKNPLTKMQALGVLMNKLLHILWALIRKKVLYQPHYGLLG